MRVIFFVIILFLSFVLIDAISTAKIENFYDTLGISEQSTLKEIKKAYRKLAQEYHPDKTITKKGAGKFNDEAIFTKLTNAYEVLSDSAKKRDYDDTLARIRNGEDVDDEWVDYEEFESKLTVLHVLVIGLVVFTALQYYYFHRSYNAAYKDAYESSFYQNKLEIFEMKKKELLRRGATEEAKFLQPPMVYVEDRKQPNWRDLYFVQFFTLPYFLYVWNQKRIKRKEDAIKEAEKIKDWNILSSQQKKEYLVRQEEKLRRRELRREEDEMKKRREQAEEKEKIENKKKESQLLQEHENKLKKLRNELRQTCEKYSVDQEKIEFLCLYLNSERLNTLVPLLNSNKKEGLSLLESTIEKIKEEREKYQDNGKKKRNSKVKEEEIEKEWSNEELKLLAQSAIKYPIGTKERLQKIAHYMKTNRTEKEIANKMKKMNEAKVDTKDFQRVENRFTKKGIVDTGPKEVSGLEEEERIKSSNKNGSDTKLSNNSEKKTSESSTSSSNEDVLNWSTQEHSLLEKALEKYNKDDPKRWENISKMVSTRSVKQCRDRYKFIVEQIKKQKTKTN